MGNLCLLTGSAFHGSGLRRQIFAQVQLGKLLVLRQDNLICIQPVELECQGRCAQAQNVAALCSVPAEEVEVPSRHIDAVDVGRAVHGYQVAPHLGIVELTLMAGRLGQRRVRLSQAKQLRTCMVSNSPCPFRM